MTNDINELLESLAACLGKMQRSNDSEDKRAVEHHIAHAVDVLDQLQAHLTPRPISEAPKYQWIMGYTGEEIVREENQFFNRGGWEVPAPDYFTCLPKPEGE